MGNDQLHIFQVGDVLVSPDIFTEYFCCDLSQCKGQCCIEGDAGAPVTLDEIAEMEEALDVVWPDLSASAQSVIDQQGVVYDFGTAFQGWVRVTLRDARVGEQVNVGGMVYVCTGQMDEQACRKFTLPVCRRVWIYGDAHFRKSQIQNVEGLVLEPAESGGMWPWTW